MQGVRVNLSSVLSTIKQAVKNQSRGFGEGLIEECISECDDLILWFGEGEFIDKAYRLKQHYESGADQEAFEDMEEALSSEVSKYMMDTNEEQEKAQEETSIDDMIEEGMSKSGDFISLEEFSTMFGKRDEQYHFIIAGEEPKLLNAMVKKLAKLLTQISYFDESKIAKIKPENMHSIIENKKEDKLLGSCVYIENASRLQEDDIKTIKNIIKQHKKDIVFILSDERLDRKSVV